MQRVANFDRVKMLLLHQAPIVADSAVFGIQVIELLFAQVSQHLSVIVSPNGLYCIEILRSCRAIRRLQAGRRFLFSRNSA